MKYYSVVWFEDFSESIFSFFFSASFILFPFSCPQTPSCECVLDIFLFHWQQCNLDEAETFETPEKNITSLAVVAFWCWCYWFDSLTLHVAKFKCTEYLILLLHHLSCQFSEHSKISHLTSVVYKTKNGRFSVFVHRERWAWSIKGTQCTQRIRWFLF